MTEEFINISAMEEELHKAEEFQEMPETAETQTTAEQTDRECVSVASQARENKTREAYIHIGADCDEPFLEIFKRYGFSYISYSRGDNLSELHESMLGARLAVIFESQDIVDGNRNMAYQVREALACKKHVIIVCKKENTDFARKFEDERGITVILITHYMDEAAKADRVVVLHKGKVAETYNIGGFNEWKNIDIIKVVINTVDRLLGRKEGEDMDLITYVTDRAGHDLRYAIDSRKLKAELGWQPCLQFEEGIEKTVKWYLENQEWMDNITSGEYEKYYEEMYADR